MINLIFLIQLFLILSFLFYGASCFLSSHIEQEFLRYKMGHWRKITGALQVTSCLGLLIGFYIPFFASLASFMLSVMMLVALIVRLRLRDSFLMMAPAAAYFFLSFFLFLTLIN